MEFSTYTKLKSEKQPFRHVHFLINGDHHIIEINDPMSLHSMGRFNKDEFRNAIKNDGKFNYEFDADDEGFYLLGGETNNDITVSGNISNHKDEFSTFHIKVLKGILIITSTFNKKKVTTVIFLDKKEEDEVMSKVIEMIRKLFFEFYNWVDECLCSDMDEFY